MSKTYKTILAIHHDMDPSAALVRNGVVLAYSEEERHKRQKHAPRQFPVRAIRSCLSICGLSATDIDCIAINWDLDAFSDGRIRTFYDDMQRTLTLDPGTIKWQDRNLQSRNRQEYEKYLAYQWRNCFGAIPLPKIMSFPHHYTHAYQAFSQSNFREALCLTLDGSGDTECTVLWQCDEKGIVPIRQFQMPHSLGWLYAAFTEYLGFEAYDGEYKVMGMASYGHPNDKLDELVSKILAVDAANGSYSVDGAYIHYGVHSFSQRYTDNLAALFGVLPRHADDEITQWHQDLAYSVQHRLETAATAIVSWGVRQTGIGNICISGGVGLNVKMNSKIFKEPGVLDVFAHPLCSDSGAVCGAGLLASSALDHSKPEKLQTLSLGHEETSDTVRRALRDTKVAFEELSYEDMPKKVAGALADDLLVGWFQGRMEAGPRALGHRSILANPSRLTARDRVNSVIKYRELWRPFCPSILSEALPRYFDKYTYSPFMIIAFDANDRLKQEAPAIVHVDGTSRVQEVRKSEEPLYYALIEEFGVLTGTPVVLNTSFNVKGEPIVCTALDALRTFFSTGLDILAIENFIIRKVRHQFE